MCQEALDRDNQTVGDTKEALYFGREIPQDSSEAQLPQHGPNQWPSPVQCSHYTVAASFMS